MKSRSILKSEYDEIGKFLCSEYIKKHKLKEKQEVTEHDITKLMLEDLPDIVAQAYKEYPKYFNLCAINMTSLTSIIEANTVSDNEEYIERKRKKFHDSSIEYANDLYEKLKELNLEKYYVDDAIGTWGYYVQDAKHLNEMKFKGLQIEDSSIYLYCEDKINYICDHIKKNPSLGKVLSNYIVEYVKYLKFRKDLSCAFSTITTTNMLKNELPEAYDFFYNTWGKKYEKQDEYDKVKKNPKKVQCDAIEGLRASLS